MNQRILAVLLIVCAADAAHAAVLQPGRAQLLCHRTANEDVPENTLESLEQAALLGCNVVEIDLRKTLDGKIVLNHDGILERLTDGVGEAETSYYDDLRLRDAGSWMGERFAGMHMALFEDALRLARERDIRLILDMKTKGIGVDVLELLQREGMLQRVQFGGEWADVKQLYPGATSPGDATTWVQAGVTAEQVKGYHSEGKAVIANFSANDHMMDLAAMKAAVAAGVDGINVDYPRLGADAVGRPVERKLAALVAQADTGDSNMRVATILELSRYRGFPLQAQFAHWLLDPDDHVSRAAAVALVTARPRTPAAVFAEATQSEHADARANAAWALGEQNAPANLLLPLLKDNDPKVLQAALMALERAPGPVSVGVLLPLLTHPVPAVRGAAAIALARHQPEVALKAVPAQLLLDRNASLKLGEDYVRRGKPKLTAEETEAISGRFRCEIKMVQALAMLQVPGVVQALEELAFRPGQDFAQFNAIVATFQLWDRIGANAQPAVAALGSSDAQLADRAEWLLVQAGPEVLPEARQALGSSNAMVRQRAIQIVAWQGDVDALPMLRAIPKANPEDANLAAWATEKIEMLHPRR